MKKIVKGLLSVAALTALSACGGTAAGVGGGSSSGNALTISGKIDMSRRSLSFEERLMTLVTDNYVSCMVLGAVPAVANTSELDSSGNFSLSLAVESGQAIGCFLRRSSVVANGFIPLVFQQVASMGGGSTGVESLSPKSDSTTLSLGNISFGTDSKGGVVAVLDAPPVENGTAAPTATFADMTGTWRMAKSYEDAANGVMHWCDMEKDDMTESEVAACKANISSQSLYLHTVRVTSSTQTRWGLSIWDSSTAYGNCGSKEGLNLDTGWSIDPTTVNSGTVTSDFAFAFPDLSNLTSTNLQKAPFRKWVSEDGVSTNCPYGQANYAGCATATTCDGFDYTTGSLSGTVQSAEKVRCVLSSIGSGGLNSYNWGSACAGRLSQDWDTVNTAVNDNGFKNDGLGCIGTSCGLTAAAHLQSDPNSRKFFSELFVDGLTGTATSDELDIQTVSSEECHMIRSIKMTVIQTSATKASVTVNFNVKPVPNHFNSSVCMGESWIAEEMSGLRTLKLDLEKQ